MDKDNSEFSLVESILIYLCEVLVFERNGVTVRYTQFLRELNLRLDKIHERCEENPALRIRYQEIEKPLYFFIDYWVLENNLSFASEYSGMGRSIDELSGDEKFFEILDCFIRSNQNKEDMYAFLLFFVLGFKGIYKQDKEKIQSYFSQIAQYQENLKKNPSLCINLLMNKTVNVKKKKHILGTKIYFIATIVLLIFSIIANFLCYRYASSEYRSLLESTVNEVIKYSI